MAIKLNDVMKSGSTYYQYQSFSDAPGAVASYKKLLAFQLPLLVGRSFLDVGCNEGFYCGVALAAGAQRVVGIDGFGPAIDRARKRFPRAEFIHDNWTRLPDGKFDVVLFSSALHYLETEGSIREMVARLCDRLAPQGLLIIETGLAPGDDSIVLDVIRESGSVRYPSLPLMTRVLQDSGLVPRIVGKSEPGDGVDRYVFHCRPINPTILFVRGEPNSGKSHLSETLLAFDRTRYVRVDQICENLYRQYLPQRQFDFLKTDTVGEIIECNGAMGETSIVEAIMEGIMAAIANVRFSERSNLSIVVDGLDYDRADTDGIFRKLRNDLLLLGYVVWDARRVRDQESVDWTHYTSGSVVDCGGYLLPVAPTNLKLDNVDFRHDRVEIQIARPYEFRQKLIAAILFKAGEPANFRTEVFTGDWTFSIPMDVFMSAGGKLGEALGDCPIAIAIELDNFTACFLDLPRTESLARVSIRSHHDDSQNATKPSEF